MTAKDIPCSQLSRPLWLVGVKGEVDLKLFIVDTQRRGSCRKMLNLNRRNSKNAHKTLSHTLINKLRAIINWSLQILIWH